MDVCCGAKRKLLCQSTYPAVGVQSSGVGGLGGAIEMQMLMTVAEDNHSRSAQAQCDRVDAVCGSQQTHPRRAATCCGLVRIDGKNKLGLCPNSH